MTRALIAAVIAVSVLCPPSSALAQWRPLHPSILSRTEVAAAKVGRHIYVVGGFDQRGATTTAAVERYDPRADRWRLVRSMPIALNHPAAAAHGGDLYVVGGYTGHADLTGPSRALLRYDPRRNRWSRLADMPTARAALAVGVVGRRLYAAGGANGVEALRTLEIYDFVRRRWSRGPDMAVAREHLAGTATGGAFYALAGRTTSQGNFTVAERFVPRRGRWERLPDLRKARGGIGAAAVNGRIVVVGGEEAAGTIAPVEAYDPGRRRWTPLAPMRTPRHGLGVVAVGRRVYALEGGPMPGFAFSRATEALALG